MRFCFLYDTSHSESYLSRMTDITLRPGESYSCSEFDEDKFTNLLDLINTRDPRHNPKVRLSNQLTIKGIGKLDGEKLVEVIHTVDQRLFPFYSDFDPRAFQKVLFEAKVTHNSRGLSPCLANAESLLGSICNLRLAINPEMVLSQGDGLWSKPRPDAIYTALPYKAQGSSRETNELALGIWIAEHKGSKTGATSVKIFAPKHVLNLLKPGIDKFFSIKSSYDNSFKSRFEGSDEALDLPNMNLDRFLTEGRKSSPRKDWESLRLLTREEYRTTPKPVASSAGPSAEADSGKCTIM